MAHPPQPWKGRATHFPATEIIRRARRGSQPHLDGFRLPQLRYGYPRQVVIVSIGDLVLDVRIVPEGPLEPDDDSPASIAIGGGGQAANFCAWTAASGEPVRLVTRIGEDETGRRLVSDLEARGGEVRAFGPARMAYVLARMKPELLFATEVEAATLAVPLESLAQVPVLKLGAAGSMVYGRKLAAPEVKMVDPTGAGDAFAATFCIAWLHGATPVEAAERAVQAASQSVTLAGARPI